MRHKSLIVMVQILALVIPCVAISGYRAAPDGYSIATAQFPIEPSQPPAARQNHPALQAMGFEENRGQTDPSVQHLVKSNGATAFLTGPSAVFALAVSDARKRDVEPQQKLRRQGRPLADRFPGEELEERPYQPIRLNFVGANQNVKLSGEEPLSGLYNYFTGSDSSKWTTGVRRFARLRGTEIYPGIDIVYYFNEGEIEYDFVVHAGADASRIRLDFDWADEVSLTPTGDLLVERGKAKLMQRKPVVYQMNDGGERRETPSRYQQGSDGRIRIDLGSYDRDRELVIDPRVAMGTFLGGSGIDTSQGIAVGSDGAIFVAGSTPSVNFPTQNPYQPLKGASDAFVTKMTADGTALVFSTFFGGYGDEVAYSVALGSDDAVYIAGITSSYDLPISPGAPQPVFGGFHDAFITKFAPSGAELAYSTFLGGGILDSRIYEPSNPTIDSATAISIFPDGSAVVTGHTFCSDFPVTPGAFQGNQTEVDAFVTKINPGGTAFTYSTYLGNSELIPGSSFNEWAYDVAAYSDGSAVVVGHTISPQFPTTPGALRTSLQGGDTFVTRLNATGTGLIYSTFLGGTGDDIGYAIAVDSSGAAYIAGLAGSTDFPMTPSAFQSTPGPTGPYSFVGKISADGTSLLYSTYLHGCQLDDIGVNSNGNFAVTGHTVTGYWIGFPLIQSCYPASGWSDAIITEFQANGAPTYSILVGGSGEEYAYGLAYDQAGRVVITGDGNSADFPISAGAFQGYTSAPYYPYDAFVAVIGAGSCTCPIEFSAANYTVAENVAGGNVTITVNRTGGCSDPVTVNYTTLANTATAASDYTTKSGTLSFASGEMSKTFEVTILNDNVDETTESFLLQLSNPGAGHVLGQLRTSVVTIEDDDVAGAFEFDQAVYTANENGGALTITVNRVGGSAGAVTVRYSTGNATATSGADYTALSNVTLSFAHGQATKTFTVAILNDAIIEGAEPFNLTLSTPSGRSTLGKQSKAVVYVLDDEIQ
jgi:hypothetical protein